MTDRDAARAAKDHLRTRLQGLPGVGGIGLGRRHGGYVITVTVAREETCAHVPGHYEGVDVEVRVGGAVAALPAAGTADTHEGAREE
ncbi:hypothetical protein [Aquipuribacter sp. SD81]|uniref:hypothetical protein n=1 Tax=Aquipuribacter sp. SD81 TaxID=3127703 RepID=UPI00301AFEBF